MKIKNPFIYLPLFSLLIIMSYTGCSNQYIEKDFDSSVSYYSKINKTFESRNAEINFINGENLSVNNIKIQQDSIYWTSKYIDEFRSLTPLPLIKKIYYSSYNSLNPVNFDGSIRLQNDSIIDVKNAIFLKDTISYYCSHDKVFCKPETEISSLSYNDHLIGMQQFGFAGMFAGILFGLQKGSSDNNRDQNPELGMIAGSIFFGLSGVIVGAIVGNSENYLLNKNDAGALKFLNKFGILTGITSSALYGIFSDNRGYTTTSNVKYTFGLYYMWDINNVFTIRPELIYNVKSGIYHYTNKAINPHNIYFQGTSSINFHVIEAPLLVQFIPPLNKVRFLRIFAGPSLNIPISGKLEEYYEGPMDQGFKYYDIKIKGKTFLSLIYGIGIKWDRHFSTEFLYDKGLTGLGSIQMSDGTILKLTHEGYLIDVTFSL